MTPIEEGFSYRPEGFLEAITIEPATLITNPVLISSYLEEFDIYSLILKPLGIIELPTNTRCFFDYLLKQPSLSDKMLGKPQITFVGDTNCDSSSADTTVTRVELKALFSLPSTDFEKIINQLGKGPIDLIWYNPNYPNPISHTGLSLTRNLNTAIQVTHKVFVEPSTAPGVPTTSPPYYLVKEI